MGGTTSTTNTTQAQKVELPAWVNQASQENYNFAKDVAGRPLEQYPGQMVADPSAMTNQGYGLIQSSIGANQPLYDQATGAYDRANSLYGDSANMYKSAAPLYDAATGAFNQASDTLGQSGAYQDAASRMYGKADATLDATNPLYGASAGLAGRAVGMLDASNPLYKQAADVYGRTTGPLDINPYLNPYTNEVENRSINNANTALTQQLAGISSDAQKAGAFGGSRFGIQQGVAQAEGARSIGDLTAALRKAGVDYATTTALNDRTGMQAGAAGLLNTAGGMRDAAGGYLGASGSLLNTAGGMRDTASGYLNTGNSTLSQIDKLLGVASGYDTVGSGRLNTAAGIGNAAAGIGNVASGVAGTGAGYLNTAANKQAAGQQDITNLMTAGQQDTSQRQSVIDAAMKKFQEKWQYPTDQLNMRLAALGMSPYGKTTTGTGTSSTETPTDWATVALGGLTAMPALLKMSDRNTKTDITKLTDGDIPMYSYRYKGDPKSYPKVVGPMAQDIEKKYPSAVKKVGKYKTIDISNLMEVLK